MRHAPCACQVGHGMVLPSHMMDRTRASILLVALAVVAIASALGYWLGGRLEGSGRTTPAPSPTGAEGPLPTIVARPPERVSPASTAAPSPSPSPKPQQTHRAEPARLTLGSVPASVRSGVPLIIRWQVRGPAGMRGASTKVVATLSGASQTIGPEAANFPLPAAFEATVVPAGDGTLTLAVEATVGGQVLRATHRIDIQAN